jgi:uncharacterized membrane protein
MAVWRDWMLWLVAGILLLTTPLEVYVIVRTRKRLPSAVAGSPLQTLEKRLAAGEISAEEFQYERYLLEKGE